MLKACLNPDTLILTIAKIAISNQALHTGNLKKSHLTNF